MQKKQRFFELITQITVRREDFGGLVFVPHTGEIIQLNPSGCRLLRQLKRVKKIRILPENLIFWQNLKAKKIVSEVISYD